MESLSVKMRALFWDLETRPLRDNPLCIIEQEGNRRQGRTVNVLLLFTAYRSEKDGMHYFVHLFTPQTMNMYR